jgi:hypothetical protein
MVSSTVPDSTPPHSATTPDSTLSPAQQKLVAVGVRLGLVTLLAFFYVDGFLRGATPLERVVFGLFALPLLAGLLHTVWELPGPSMPSWADAIASALGASAVAFIARAGHIEPVLAAAVVGVLGALPILPASIRSVAAPIYVGAFAGMTSPLVLAHPGWIALAGAVAGLLYVRCQRSRASGDAGDHQRLVVPRQHGSRDGDHDHQHENRRANDAGDDDMHRVQPLHVLGMAGRPADAEERPGHGARGLPRRRLPSSSVLQVGAGCGLQVRAPDNGAVGAGGVLPPTSKNVYDSVIVFTSRGMFGSSTKTTGNLRDSLPSSVCCLKQKHSILRKYFADAVGA